MTNVVITEEQFARLLAHVSETTAPAPAPAAQPAPAPDKPLWELSERELSERLRESVSTTWRGRTGNRTMWD